VIEGQHNPFLWPRFAGNVAITGQFPDPKDLKIICVLDATRDEWGSGKGDAERDALSLGEHIVFCCSAA